MYVQYHMTMISYHELHVIYISRYYNVCVKVKINCILANTHLLREIGIREIGSSLQ